MRIDGKSVVVTGAGRGLGRAYAVALAAAGADVVVNDVDEEVAAETVDAIERDGGRAVAAVVPVGDAEAAEQIVAVAVEQFGGLDVMVTNAGVLRDRSLVNTTDEDFDAVIRTHLRGTFTCGREAFKVFKQQGRGGRLVLVGSLAGQRGNFGQTAYSSAKAAIATLAKTWAKEGARADIAVNAVIPIALTRMVATIPALADITAAYERGEPIPPDVLRRGLGGAEHVAPLVVFLASDEAAGITGQCIGLGGTKLSIWSQPTELAVAVNDDGWTADTIASTWTQLLAQHSQPVVAS